MKQRQQQTAGSGKRPPEKEGPSECKVEESSEDSCRCKEVAKKTPAELLKLMIRDLAFRKKVKGSK